MSETNKLKMLEGLKRLNDAIEKMSPEEICEKMEKFQTETPPEQISQYALLEQLLETEIYACTKCQKGFDESYKAWSCCKQGVSIVRLKSE